MMFSNWPHTFGIMSRTFGVRVTCNIGQRLSRISTKPHKRSQLESFFIEPYPNDTSTGFFGKGTTNRYFARRLCLQLNVANNLSTGHYYIVAVSVELRTKNLNICHPEFPKCSKNIADENVFNYALP